MKDLDFGLVDDVHVDDSDSEELESKSIDKSVPSNDIVTRFDQLKQVRAKIQSKHETKRLKKAKVKRRIDSKDKNSEILVSNRPGSSLTTNSLKVIDKEDQESLEEIERKLEKAIEEKDIELASKLSDLLHQTETRVEQKRVSAVVKYKSKLDALKAKKKQKLEWKFEAKKR